MKLLKLLFNLFFNRKSRVLELSDAYKSEKIKFISLSSVITSSGRYPKREDYLYSLHYNDREILIENMMIVVKKVNNLLNDLGYEDSIDITSGLRTPESNKKAGGAKKSAHMEGMAVDILDDEEQSLYHAIYGDGSGELLRKHGLFMEKGEYTRGKYTNWVHLDFKQRKDRKDRTFVP